MALYRRCHRVVLTATPADEIPVDAAGQNAIRGAMLSPFPRPGRSGQQQPRKAHHPVAITCLQWDCDGALDDEDREWMLQTLAAQDPLGVVLIPWERASLMKSTTP
jgi:hypothetical protein